MSEQRPYRTVFLGRLVQESALSVGGAEGGSGSDMPLALDGLGRPVLRGETLAGALVATARRLVEDCDWPNHVSAGVPSRKGGDAPPRSLWRIENAHIADGADPRRAIRSGVGIRQDTGARREGALFDVETLPRRTEWDFWMEVDLCPIDCREEGKDTAAEASRAERLAAAALLEWQRGRCWIGRSVARGLGWLRLDRLRAYRLFRPRHVDLWPDGRLGPAEALKMLESLAEDPGGGIEPIPAAAFATSFGRLPVGPRWRYVEIDGDLLIGESPNGYGLDAAAVDGGGDGRAAFVSGHTLQPRGMTTDAFKDKFEPDAGLQMLRRPDGELEPFIAGSSLRGPLRHALSRLARKGGQDVRDPNVEPRGKRQPADAIEALFGDTVDSARLLVRDAFVRDDRWRTALLHQHAEDEFSQGVYGSALFSRLALLEGRFGWRMVIEAPSGEDAMALWRMLLPALQLGANNHLPVGAAKWRGLGWCRWELRSARIGQAGEDASVDLWHA